MSTTIRLVRDDLRPPGPPPRRHLLAVTDLTHDDVQRLLGTARTFESALDREVKKLPTLKGRLVVNLFYESSTRTSSSFELAAKRLVGRQGRVAEGHRDHARRLRPGRDRDPPSADRRAATRRARDERARRQRRRR
jgi:hypothetical protein